ncbi:MAG: tetratricopeptide repeat protein [Candidatus Levyibacteriota bacterium]
MLSVPEIIFYYVQTLLFPKDLVALHSWAVTSVQLSNFFLPLLIDIVAFGTILTAFWFTYRKKSREKIALLFLGWFVIGLCVHLQIFPIDMTVADHYFYFPFIGLLGLLGLVLQQLPFKRQHLILVVTIEVILLAACSARTMVRNTDWINQTTLSAHDEKVAENDYLIEMLYGLDLLEQDNYTAAYPHIMRAVTLYPQSWKAWLALGAIYYQRGNLKKAEDAYRHSIAIRKSSMAYEDLALILLREPADLRTTMAFLREATHVYPNSQKLWYYRMIAERKSGDYDNELQAAQNYHFLRGDKESESIYMRILQNQPIKFDL